MSVLEVFLIIIPTLILICIPRTIMSQRKLINPDLVAKILESYNEPIVFKGYIDNWKIIHWTLNDWEQKLGYTKLQFRKYYFIKSSSPIWDQTCTTTHLTMQEFIKLTSSENNNFWLYFDYKYMEDWFQKYTEILNDISWSKFGHPEMSGNESTIWIGSQGAHTPCHADTYGFNLIAQVYGRKRWIVFPPDADLKPTRVPYEESTVYSKLNFFSPNYDELKHLQNARVIDLNPGEVLYLPIGWWHYVENLDVAISINVWIPQPQDDIRRVEEAFTQMFISQLSKMLDTNEKSMILNPSCVEVPNISLSNSVALLNSTIELCKDPIYSRKATDSQSSISNLDILSILEQNKTVQLIPVLSAEEFASIIEQQQDKYFTVESEEQKSSNVAMVEAIINAVCSPKILAQIGEKLLED